MLSCSGTVLHRTEILGAPTPPDTGLRRPWAARRRASAASATREASIRFPLTHPIARVYFDRCCSYLDEGSVQLLQACDIPLASIGHRALKAPSAPHARSGTTVLWRPDCALAHITEILLQNSMNSHNPMESPRRRKLVHSTRPRRDGVSIL